jgi:hypothetical protein
MGFRAGQADTIVQGGYGLVPHAQPVWACSQQRAAVGGKPCGPRAGEGGLCCWGGESGGAPSGSVLGFSG